MLYAAQANSKALDRFTPHILKEIPKVRLGQQAEIAPASFKAGVCVSANLTIGQFDSHANNDADQMTLIPEFLAGVAYLLRGAESLGLRYRLVVIAQSEMGCTPTCNAGGGKDRRTRGLAHVSRARDPECQLRVRRSDEDRATIVYAGVRGGGRAAGDAGRREPIRGRPAAGDRPRLAAEMEAGR